MGRWVVVAAVVVGGRGFLGKVWARGTLGGMGSRSRRGIYLLPRKGCPRCAARNGKIRWVGGERKSIPSEGDAPHLLGC